MSVWERIQEVIQRRHDYARRWKERTGGKVFGYLCTYVPEEVIYAAGILPVRILGSHEAEDVTANYIFHMFCPYCRDCLAQGLLGRYEYLDGLVHAYSCIHIRQTYDSWVRHLTPSFSYFLYMPDNLRNPAALRQFVREVFSFKEALEAWTGRKISTESLEQAIEVYNLNRRLLREIYNLRKPDPPLLLGSEALGLVLAGMLMDKAEHNELLKQAYEEITSRHKDSPGLPRLMLISSENDDLELVSFIESLGTRVVVDDNCVGTRYFMEEVPLGGEPLEGLALRYARRPLCPVKDIAGRERLHHILELTREYQVQGAIFLKAKFCDPQEYDIPAISAALKERNIPSLVLECDLVNPVGQFRTRIEAFLEMLHLEIV